jgi:hypothetical protein
MPIKAGKVERISCQLKEEREREMREMDQQ